MVEKVIKYRTNDGSTFDREDMAEQHELICDLTGKLVSTFENFTIHKDIVIDGETRNATIKFVQRAREEIKTFLQLKDSDFVLDSHFYLFSRLIDHMLIDVYNLSIPYDREMEIKLKFYKEFDYDQMVETSNPYDHVVEFINDHHDVFVNKLKEVAD